jgi:hypothetical protein
VAEGPALEKRYPVKNGIVGSNPTLSATISWFAGAISGCRLPPAVSPPRWSPWGAGGNLFKLAHFFRGEMSELAEGARLEIVCAVKSGTEGSNPSLSATFFQFAPPPVRLR